MTCAGELLCASSRAWLPSRSARKPGHRTGWVLAGHWKKTLPERHAQEQRRDTASRGCTSRSPGGEVSGSGWTDVLCGGSTAWSGAVAALNTMPGVTWVAGWHPTQGPPFPRGLGSTPPPLTAPGDHQVVVIPRMDSRVKYLHSIDFPFICGKSVCFSWFPVFAF